MLLKNVVNLDMVTDSIKEESSTHQRINGFCFETCHLVNVVSPVPSYRNMRSISITTVPIEEINGSSGLDNLVHLEGESITEVCSELRSRCKYNLKLKVKGRK